MRPSRAQNVALLSAVHAQLFDALQVCGNVHVPQLAERALLQLSFPTTVPQSAPSRAQKDASVSAEQPQTLLEPHVCAPWQLPQLALLGVPQLSLALMAPQFLPRREQNAESLSGVQATHWPALLHCAFAAHAPQSGVRLAPQRSTTERPPHVQPAAAHSVASDSGSQAVHWPAVQV